MKGKETPWHHVIGECPGERGIGRSACMWALVQKETMNSKAQRSKTQRRSSTKITRSVSQYQTAVIISYFHRNSTVCGDARAPVLPSSGIPCQCDFGTVIGITPLMTLMDVRPKKSENRCLLRSEIVPGGQMALERASGGDPGESWISPETSSVKYNTN
jgi:hypothetical protein